MLKNPETKYQPFYPICLTDRTWLNNRITSAPRWCSVDLRDVNQALPKPMDIETKIKMFEWLIGLGFKEIEAGYPSASGIEFNFMRRLIMENLIPDDVTIQVLTPARAELIDRTIQSLIGAKRVIVHLYNGVGPAQQKSVFKCTEHGLIELAIQGVLRIQSQLHNLVGTDVTLQYSPEYFGATPLDLSKRICEAVMKTWGATPERKVILNLPESVELLHAGVYPDMIEWMCRNLENRESAIISLHVHNDRGTGIAKMEFGLMAGGERVEVAVLNAGERAGQADAVTLGGNMYSNGVFPGLNLGKIGGIAERYEEFTGLSVSDLHPYAGSSAFLQRSGGHQHAVVCGLEQWRMQGFKGNWHGTVPYLHVDPEDFGISRPSLFRVTTQSGARGIGYLLQQYFDVRPPKEMLRDFNTRSCREIDRLGAELGHEDLKRMFWSEYVDVATPLEFIRFESSDITKSGTGVQAYSEITENGHTKSAKTTGKGPIDAFKVALIKMGIPAFEVLNYHADSLGTDAEAQAIAYVPIEIGHEVWWGAGVDANSEWAPLRAIICAVNRYLAAETSKGRDATGGLPCLIGSI